MADQHKSGYHLRPNPKPTTKKQEAMLCTTKPNVPDQETTGQTNIESQPGQEPCDVTTHELDTTSIEQTPIQDSTEGTITPQIDPIREDIKTIMECLMRQEQKMKEMKQTIEHTSEQNKQEMREMKQTIEHTSEQNNQEMKEMKQEMKQNNLKMERMQTEFYTSLGNLTMELQKHKQESEEQQNEFQTLITLDLTKHTKETHALLEQGQIATENKLAQLESNHKEQFQILHNDIEMTRQQSQQTCCQIKLDIGETIEKLEQRMKTIQLDENLVKPQTPYKPEIHITCPGSASIYGDQQIPKFTGREKNPVEFLNKLKNFYQKQQQFKHMQGSTEMLHEILDQSLEKYASRWWQFNKHEVEEWKDFEIRFLEKYWSREIQRGIRNRLEVERYRPDGHLSRSEYFIERVVTMKMMLPRPSEDEIITILSEHFSELIQDAKRVQNVQTIREFELLLQREDLQDAHRQSRNQYRPPPTSPKRPKSNYEGPPRIQYKNHLPSEPVKFNAYQPRTQPPRNSNFTDNARTNNNSYRPNYNNDTNRGQRPPHRNPSPPRYGPTYPTQEQKQVCHAIIEANPPTPPVPQTTATSKTQTTPLNA